MSKFKSFSKDIFKKLRNQLEDSGFKKHKSVFVLEIEQDIYAGLFLNIITDPILEEIRINPIVGIINCKLNKKIQEITDDKKQFHIYAFAASKSMSYLTSKSLYYTWNFKICDGEGKIISTIQLIISIFFNQILPFFKGYKKNDDLYELISKEGWFMRGYSEYFLTAIEIDNGKKTELMIRINKELEILKLKQDVTSVNLTKFYIKVKETMLSSL